MPSSEVQFVWDKNFEAKSEIGKDILRKLENQGNFFQYWKIGENSLPKIVKLGKLFAENWKMAKPKFPKIKIMPEEFKSFKLAQDNMWKYIESHTQCVKVDVILQNILYVIGVFLFAFQ